MKVIIAFCVWLTVGAMIAILMGCATEPKLHVEPTAQIVNVPVITPCIAKIPEPDVPFLTDAQLLDGTDYQVVNNLRIDRDMRREYEATLVSTMQACVVK